MMEDSNLDTIKSTSRKGVVFTSVTNLIIAVLGMIFINLYEYEVLKNMQHAYSLPSYIIMNMMLVVTIIASLYCANMTCSYKNVAYLWGFVGYIYIVFALAFLEQYLFDLPVIYDPDHKYVYTRSEAAIEERSHGVVQSFKPYWGLFQKPELVKAFQSFDTTIANTIRNVTPPLFNTSMTFHVQLRPLILIPPLLTKTSFCLLMGLLCLQLKLLCIRITSSQNKNKNIIRGIESRKTDCESLVDNTFSDEVNKTRRTRIWLTTIRRLTRILGVISLIVVGALTVIDHQQTEIMVYHVEDAHCAGTLTHLDEQSSISDSENMFNRDEITTTSTTSTTTLDGILISYAGARCYTDDVSYIMSKDTTARWIQEGSPEVSSKVFESDRKLIIPTYYTIVAPYILSGFPIIWEVIMTTRVISLIGFFTLSMKKLQSNLFCNIFLLLVIVSNFICVLFSHPNLVGSIVGDIFDDVGRVDASGTILGFPNTLTDHYMSEFDKQMLRHVDYDGDIGALQPARQLKSEEHPGFQNMFSQYCARRFESMYYCFESTARNLLRYVVEKPEFDISEEMVKEQRIPNVEKIISYCSDSTMPGSWRTMFGVTTLTIFGVPLILAILGLTMNVYCSSILKKLLVREHKLQSIVISRSVTATPHPKELGLVTKTIPADNLIPINHMEPVLTPSNTTYTKNQINRPVVRGYTPSLTPRSKRAFLLLNGNN